ncbi:hypothetical protein DMB66_11305 [Actinoplanes sp. ATCC 53533]|uniref:Rv1733c family protein n=1 Tax=Actinoplanes sp. ATCC 53533 TaxID=1288362 RepID=UPI000F790ED0|nr:hypothetical protein [Actinoplanes sp. ATCC 53533]RSM69571.1 hypothetical protein DMB66_11305 [Actinoplanes sp. ATCC 53533]
MWERRIVRRMPWRRAPLRRGSDKIQAWLTLVVIMAVLPAAPWVAWWTASTTYGAEVRASEWEVAHRRAVAAVLVRDAAADPPAGEALPGPEHVPAPVRWTDSDGTVRSAAVPVAVGTRAGSPVTVWVDEHGALTSPPRRRNPTLDASVAATFAVTAVIAFLVGVRRVVVWRLDRRRMRSWETEWQIIGPRWSRR